jgi:hypothetical protein
VHPSFVQRCFYLFLKDNCVTVTWQRYDRMYGRSVLLSKAALDFTLNGGKLSISPFERQSPGYESSCEGGGPHSSFGFHG